MDHLIQPDMFSQPYMQNALLTGSIAAVLAGLVGFFVVLRGMSFAAHALGQIGFAGAAGAVLISATPLLGLVVFAVGGALGLGLLGVREHGRDAITALVLVAALGLGALFIALNSSYATAAFTLLFGTIVGISREQVWQTGLLTLGCLLGLVALYRPLLLSTVDAEMAAARGVPVRLVGVLFAVVVGVAAAVTIPTVGTLLIFSLMVGPAAAASYLASRPWLAMGLAIVLALAATWVGLVVAYDTGWPIGFIISAAVTALYLAARLLGPRVRRRLRGAGVAEVSILAQRYAPDPASMPLQGSQQSPGGDLPELDRPVKAAAGQHSPVPAQRHARDGANVSPGRQQQGAVCDPPQVHLARGRSGRQIVAVGAER